MRTYSVHLPAGLITLTPKLNPRTLNPVCDGLQTTTVLPQIHTTLVWRKRPAVKGGHYMHNISRALYGTMQSSSNNKLQQKETQVKVLVVCGMLWCSLYVSCLGRRYCR